MSLHDLQHESDASDSQAALAEALAEAGRALSTAEVLFHRAVAESAGLSPGDHKYLDVLLQEGPMPAGRLAELTGLTTGAVTGIVDRLEEAGLVRRTRDPDDRRKVIIRLREKEAMRKLGPAFEGLREAVDRLAARYTEEELAAILDYMRRCTVVLREQTQRLTGKG